MPKACGDPESVFGLLLRGVYAELCRSAHRNTPKECLFRQKTPFILIHSTVLTLNQSDVIMYSTMTLPKY